MHVCENTLYSTILTGFSLIIAGDGGAGGAGAGASVTISACALNRSVM